MRIYRLVFSFNIIWLIHVFVLQKTAKNVPKCVRLEQSHCFPLFSDALFAVAVVVSLIRSLASNPAAAASLIIMVNYSPYTAFMETRHPLYILLLLIN